MFVCLFLVNSSLGFPQKIAAALCLNNNNTFITPQQRGGFTDYFPTSRYQLRVEWSKTMRKTCKVIFEPPVTFRRSIALTDLYRPLIHVNELVVRSIHILDHSSRALFTPRIKGVFKLQASYESNALQLYHIRTDFPLQVISNKAVIVKKVLYHALQTPYNDNYCYITHYSTNPFCL